MSDQPARPSSASIPGSARTASSPRRSWLPWIVAVLLLALVGFLGQAYLASRLTIASLREQNDLTAVEIKSLQQRLEAERILSARRAADLRSEPGAPAVPAEAIPLERLQITALTAPPGLLPAPTGVVAWDPQAQEGMMTVTRLPVLPPDQAYQLWIVEAQSPLHVDAGTFTMEPGHPQARVPFRPVRPVTSASRFVVTVEHRGGALRAEGRVVLAGP